MLTILFKNNFLIDFDCMYTPLKNCTVIQVLLKFVKVINKNTQNSNLPGIVAAAESLNRQP